MRNVILATDEVYHVFNRGVEKRLTFTRKHEYKRAIMTLDFYRYRNNLRLAKFLQLNQEKKQAFLMTFKHDSHLLVEIICYCFMPNHFHFLLKQKRKNGISKFVSNFTNSYTRYFNAVHRRIGPLFQGNFKAVRIEDEEQLFHVSRYIHLNPVTAFLVDQNDLENYIWSSLPEYIYNQQSICTKEFIYSQFTSPQKYRQFILNQADYAKKLESIKHLTLEN